MTRKALIPEDIINCVMFTQKSALLSFDKGKVNYEKVKAEVYVMELPKELPFSIIFQLNKEFTSSVSCIPPLSIVNYIFIKHSQHNPSLIIAVEGTVKEIPLWKSITSLILLLTSNLKSLLLSDTEKQHLLYILEMLKEVVKGLNDSSLLPFLLECGFEKPSSPPFGVPRLTFSPYEEFILAIHRYFTEAHFEGELTFFESFSPIVKEFLGKVEEVWNMLNEYEVPKSKWVKVFIPKVKKYAWPNNVKIDEVNFKLRGRKNCSTLLRANPITGLSLKMLIDGESYELPLILTEEVLSYFPSLIKVVSSLTINSSLLSLVNPILTCITDVPYVVKYYLLQIYKDALS